MSNMKKPIKSDNGSLPKWESDLTEEQEQENTIKALLSQYNAVMESRDRILTPSEVIETLRKSGAGTSEELIEKVSQIISSQSVRELINDKDQNKERS